MDRAEPALEIYQGTTESIGLDPRTGEDTRNYQVISLTLFIYYPSTPSNLNQEIGV